jgi:hypothetical protein
MRAWSALVLCGSVASFVTATSLQPDPPAILQIYRVSLKPGTEISFDAIERQIAALCASLKCPHPYLGLESITGPKEVWFLNGYRSADEQKEVDAAYKRNVPLMTGMTELAARRSRYTHSPSTTIATRPTNARSGTTWSLGRGRFLVVVMTHQTGETDGAVYDGPEGLRVIIWPVQTREEAERRAAALGAEARVLAVRPEWTRPDPAWIEHDPPFWRKPR